MARRQNKFSDVPFRLEGIIVSAAFIFVAADGSPSASRRNKFRALRLNVAPGMRLRGKTCPGEMHTMRKLIAFDDDTFDKLTQLGRGRMATLQELADEAFADLLKKHGIPIDLKDALRKSAGVAKEAAAKARSKDSKR
jgi:hypothetical protein